MLLSEARKFAVGAPIILAVSLALSACAGDSDDGETMTEASLRSPRDLARFSELSSATELDENGLATVRYAGAVEGYDGPPKFEVVRFTVPPSSSVNVQLRGDFPSNAQLLLADTDFNVLSSATTAPGELGDVAELVAPVGVEGEHLILVRDAEWQNPMTFEIEVVVSPLENFGAVESFDEE